MKNSKVKGTGMRSNTAELPNSSDPRLKVIALERGENRVRLFSKVSDEVAQSDHWFKNEPIPFGLDLFPNDWFMRYSDLFYPNAKGGPIHIDIPGSPTDIMYCERKLEAYRAKGVRYTYIKANEDASEALMRLDPVLPKGAKEGINA